MAERESLPRQATRVWVAYDYGTSWEVDGPHSPESDLTRTYQILNRLSEPRTILRLEIDGEGWPRVENVTASAKGAGKAEPMPWG